MGAVHFEQMDGLGVIRIDNPPVNALSSQVRQGIRAALDEVAARPDLAGAILTGSLTHFSSGADMRQFGTPHYTAYPRTGELADLIEAMAKPVVAAIGGFAMGGGLELALAAHGRVAAREARMALPEIHIGLIPAGGGILRLPRLVGVRAAVDLMGSGRTVTADEALRLGLVDAMGDADPVPAAKALLADILTGHRPWRRALELPLPASAAGDLAAAGGVLTPAPGTQEALDGLLACIRSVIEASPDVARDLIQRTSTALVAAEASEGLRYVFLGKRAVAKAARPQGTAPAPLRTIRLLGDGQREARLAQRLREAGLTVDLSDPEPQGAPVGQPCDLVLACGGPHPRLPRGNVPAATLHLGGLDGQAPLAEAVPWSLQALETVDWPLLGSALGMVCVPSRRGPLGPRLWRALVEAADELRSEGVPADTIDGTLRAWGLTCAPLGTPGGLSAARSGAAGQDIIERCALSLVNEGARCREEDPGLPALAVDMVMVCGYGFPPASGGPNHMANRMGLKAALRAMRRFRARGSAVFGRISPLLERQADAGRDLE